MTLELIEVSGSVQSIDIDPTMVSGFGQDRPMLVSLRANTPLPNVLRAEIERVRLTLPVSNLPVGAMTVVDSGSLRYRTDHLSHHLFLKPQDPQRPHARRPGRDRHAARHPGEAQPA